LRCKDLLIKVIGFFIENANKPNVFIEFGKNLINGVNQEQKMELVKLYLNDFTWMVYKAEGHLEHEVRSCDLSSITILCLFSSFLEGDNN